MSPRLSLLSLSLLCAASASALDLGDLVFVGDSITQGGNGDHASYRYNVWKTLVDNNTAYTFVGSQTGAYTNSTVTTPDYRSASFANIHEGHFGWRASWETGAVALPSGRYDTNNLGRGTIANWTTGAGTFATGDKGVLTYNDGVHAVKPGYTPDTVVIMIGINDIADGITAATAESRIRTIVQQYQAANANARIFVASTLNVSVNHNLAATMNPKVDALNASLATSAAGWSTGTSTVTYADVRTGFDATKMTYDNTHPNMVGERIIAQNLAAAMGVGARDNTLGRVSRATGSLANINTLDTMPSTGTGTFQLKGNASKWTVGTTSKLVLNTGSTASYLQHAWGLTAASAPSFTAEASFRIADTVTTNHFDIWVDDGAGGAGAGYLSVFADHTQWGNGAAGFALDFLANNDAMHTFRVSYVSGAGYFVWRDGKIIGENLIATAVTDGLINAAVFGRPGSADATNALVNYVATDTTGGYSVIAVPEPATYGLLGTAGVVVAAFARRRRKLAHAA